VTLAWQSRDDWMTARKHADARLAMWQVSRVGFTLAARVVTQA